MPHLDTPQRQRAMNGLHDSERAAVDISLDLQLGSIVGAVVLLIQDRETVHLDVAGFHQLEPIAFVGLNELEGRS